MSHSYAKSIITGGCFGRRSTRWVPWVKAVGLAHLVLETDCPYLAPVPHRGGRNEPAYVSVTAHALADLLGTTAQNVASATTENARTVFGRALTG